MVPCDELVGAGDDIERDHALLGGEIVEPQDVTDNEANWGRVCKKSIASLSQVRAQGNHRRAYRSYEGEPCGYTENIVAPSHSKQPTESKEEENKPQLN